MQLNVLFAASFGDLGLTVSKMSLSSPVWSELGRTRLMTNFFFTTSMSGRASAPVATSTEITENREDVVVNTNELYYFVWFSPASWAASIAQLVEHRTLWVTCKSYFSSRMTGLSDLCCTVLALGSILIPRSVHYLGWFSPLNYRQMYSCIKGSGLVLLHTCIVELMGHMLIY